MTRILFLVALALMASTANASATGFILHVGFVGSSTVMEETIAGFSSLALCRAEGDEIDRVWKAWAPTVTVKYTCTNTN